MTVSTLLQHETLGKPDHYGTYAVVADENPLKQKTGPAAHTYTLGWQVQGNQGGSGIRGLILERDTTAYPVGLTLRSDGAAVWDTIALDALTTNIVLAYSHLKAGGGTDMIRGDVESHWTISDTAGPPANTNRLNLESTAADAATINTMLKVSVATGSPVNATGKFLAQYSVAGTTVHQMTKDGYAAFGFTYGGTLSGAGLETINGAVIRATDINPTLWLARRGTTTADWVMRVVSTGSGQFELLDNASQRRPLIFRTTAADATIFADTNGLILGATAQKLGFRGTTPITKPAATPADATDLASAITLLNYLKNSVIIAHGLAA